MQKDHPEALGNNCSFPVACFAVIPLVACERYKYFLFLLLLIPLSLVLLMWPKKEQKL